MIEFGAEITPFDTEHPVLTSFLANLFGIDTTTCFIGEDSLLSDFVFSGVTLNTSGKSLEDLYSEWDEWVIDAVFKQYGVRLLTTNVPLLWLAQQLKPVPKVLH